MNSNLELFQTSDYVDRTSNSIDVSNRKIPKDSRSEYEQIVKSWVAEWESAGLDTNDVLLEMKLGEIKKILTYCTLRQRENFGTRLFEWIFFKDDARS